jgi:hypothetical protein
LYGCETWTAVEEDRIRIQVVEVNSLNMLKDAKNFARFALKVL